MLLKNNDVAPSAFSILYLLNILLYPYYSQYLYIWIYNIGYTSMYSIIVVTRYFVSLFDGDRICRMVVSNNKMPVSS